MFYDDAYANAPYIEGAAAYPARWRAAAEGWAAHCAAKGRYRPGLSYGPGARERFDLFLAEGAARGLVVFVHGGFWHRFGRGDWLHLSQGALARGWAVAVPSYDLCPAIRIAGITRQIARAVAAAAREVDGPLVLTGHSAGGHLVARMLAPGMLTPDLAVRLQRVLPISPLADLRPLLQTTMNTKLRLDAVEATAESPLLMRDRLNVPVSIFVGADERPAFLDQARWLSQAWQAEQVVVPARHHFDVIDDLRVPRSAMMQALLG